jgi:endonuclease-3
VPRPRTPKGRARETARRLAIEYPGTAKDLCELDFQTPFQLLVATVLSAQTTDDRVNMVTPGVFARYPTPADLGHADPTDLELLIHSTGFFRSKAKSLIGLGLAIDERFGGQVPTAMADLVTIPGVGRKTANVLRSVGFGQPGLPVDTHVTRLTRLLGLTASTDPDRIEQDVCALLPRAEWGAFSLRLILHGRRVCIARRPRCAECVLSDFCPSANIPVLAPAEGRRRAQRTVAGPRAGATVAAAVVTGAGGVAPDR